jgi:membrane associated rhomboid family serine protease
MWTLFIFGDNVEDRMGHFRYLLFYLLCGVIASFTHFYLYQDSNVPAIGASGAISAVMGAYMFLFPRARIIFFIPIIIIPLFIPIPAFIYLALWFAGQFYNGTISYLGESSTGIAFWAHIGGFVGGAVLFSFFLKRNRRKKKVFV